MILIEGKDFVNWRDCQPETLTSRSWQFKVDPEHKQRNTSQPESTNTTKLECPTY